MSRWHYLNALTSILNISSQMALNIMLSLYFYNTIGVFTYFTGLYLLSMGLGVFILKYLSEYGPKKIIFYNIFFSLILSNSLFFMKFIDNNLILFITATIITIFLGIASGIELPAYVEFNENNSFWYKILGSDYFGSFFGIILYTFFIYPFFGLFNGIYMIQLIFIILIIPFIIKNRK